MGDQQVPAEARSQDLKIGWPPRSAPGPDISPRDLAQDDNTMILEQQYHEALEAASDLFRRYNHGQSDGGIGTPNTLEITKDGRRFVAIAVGRQPSRPITLVTNWDADLRK